MSVARENFISRIEAIRTTLKNPISVDTTPVPIPSSAAVVVRNGCTVMLFCALETFIRNRSLECAGAINQIQVPYAQLSDDLKYASLVSTFDGLAMATRGWPKSDKILEFERAAVAVASGSLGSPYQFTEYSFARDKSNVTADDIVLISKTFGVENFWQSAGKVSLKAGITIPGRHEDIFRLLARERHKAAHVAQHNVSHYWVESALFQTLSIAIAFDALISTAAFKLNTKGATARATLKITENDVDFLTVKPRVNGDWAGYQPSKTRASFVAADQSSALARAVTLGGTHNLSVVCHDTGSRPTRWATVLG